MFPTNTVVVGPPVSSGVLGRGKGRSFLGTAGLLTTDTEVGTSTCETIQELQMGQHKFKRSIGLGLKDYDVRLSGLTDFLFSTSE